MFGKIKWLITLSLLVFVFVTCTLEDGTGEATVTFDANGGTGTPPSSITGKSGTSISLPPATGLSRDDYNFNGWNERQDGLGNTYKISFVIPSSDITLYAEWITDTTRGPEKTHTVDFSTSSHFDTATIPFFDFNSIFRGSATVEIYAGGAGGGGAGGHHREGFIFTPSDYYSAGGGGGGGAVEYRKIEIQQQTNFSVSIGNGGGAGNFASKPYAGGGQMTGGNGSDGGNTTVSWGNTTLTAEGGKRGLGGGPDNVGTGGAGGGATTSGGNGGRGSDGTRAGSGINTNYQGRSAGGSGGSYNGFWAGNGGYGGGANKSSEAGGRGDGGTARIIVTWYEKL